MTSLLTNHPIAHTVWNILQASQAAEYLFRYGSRIANAITAAFSNFALNLIAPLLSATKIVETTIRVLCVVGVMGLLIGGIAVCLRSGRPATQ